MLGRQVELRMCILAALHSATCAKDGPAGQCLAPRYCGRVQVGENVLKIYTAEVKQVDLLDAG